MRNICWLLICVAAIAFVIGAVLAFSNRTFLVPPYAYWRGAIGFLLFAIALRMMDRP